MAGKRANGEGTISQRKSDGRWIGQISLYTPDGKTKRICVSDKTQQGCKKKLDATKLKYQNKPYVQPTRQMFVQYLDTWLNQKAKLEKLKSSTIDTHKKRINTHIKPFFKNIEIQKITVQMLNNFYTILTDKVSAHTVHKIHNIINNSLKFAVRDGLIPYNPATNALLPKFTIPKSTALSSDELTQLIEAARKYQNRPTTKSFNTYPLIALAINTGMRRGELAALQWCDIDLDNKCIHINHAIMEIRGHCFIDTPKNESSRRTIFISPAMTEILRNHKKVATGKFVFPSITNLDKPMMPSRIYTIFSKVINSIGLKCKLHTLRHTHITQLLENGVNIKTIQDRVGHTQISTTMGYCHPSKEKDQAAAAMFDQFIQ